ncbi:MAG: hypothetical protein ACE5FL_09210 [Myxococcota bacterium]
MACGDALPGAGDPDPSDDCRCLCGSLLARMVEGAVELKCRRCKRTLLVPFAEEAREIAQVRPGSEMIPARRAG